MGASRRHTVLIDRSMAARTTLGLRTKTNVRIVDETMKMADGMMENKTFSNVNVKSKLPRHP